MKAVIEWPCCREQAIFNYRARREYRERPRHLSDTFTKKAIKDRYIFNRESIYFIADLIREVGQRGETMR